MSAVHVLVTYKEEEVEDEQEVLGDCGATFPHSCASARQKKYRNYLLTLDDSLAVLCKRYCEKSNTRWRRDKIKKKDSLPCLTDSTSQPRSTQRKSSQLGS